MRNACSRSNRSASAYGLVSTVTSPAGSRRHSSHRYDWMPPILGGKSLVTRRWRITRRPTPPPARPAPGGARRGRGRRRGRRRRGGGGGGVGRPSRRPGGQSPGVRWDIRARWPRSDADRHLWANVHRCPTEGGDWALAPAPCANHGGQQVPAVETGRSPHGVGPDDRIFVSQGPLQGVDDRRVVAVSGVAQDDEGVAPHETGFSAGDVPPPDSSHDLVVSGRQDGQDVDRRLGPGLRRPATSGAGRPRG